MDWSRGLVELTGTVWTFCPSLRLKPAGDDHEKKREGEREGEKEGAQGMPRQLIDHTRPLKETEMSAKLTR